MAAQARALAREVQHRFGQHGLARAGLTHKHDILYRYFLSHGSS
jgi:hypothetical protein